MTFVTDFSIRMGSVRLSRLGVIMAVTVNFFTSPTLVLLAFDWPEQGEGCDGWSGELEGSQLIRKTPTPCEKFGPRLISKE